jgi:hypothetical protein
VGIRKLPMSVTIGAAGTGTITFSAARATNARPFVVQQVSVKVAGTPIGATCELQVNGVFLTALIPTGDVADGVPAIELGPFETLAVVWAGCTPTQVATALFIYDDGT